MAHYIQQKGNLKILLKKTKTSQTCFLLPFYTHTHKQEQMTHRHTHRQAYAWAQTHTYSHTVRKRKVWGMEDKHVIVSFHEVTLKVSQPMIASPLWCYRGCLLIGRSAHHSQILFIPQQQILCCQKFQFFFPLVLSSSHFCSLSGLGQITWESS